MAGKTLGQYAAEAQRAPFVLDAGDAQLTIQPPTVSTILAIEESSNSREALQLIAGDQYDALLAAIEGLPAGVLDALLGDMRRHFGLGN